MFGLPAALATPALSRSRIPMIAPMSPIWRPPPRRAAAPGPRRHCRRAALAALALRSAVGEWSLPPPGAAPPAPPARMPRRPGGWATGAAAWAAAAGVETLAEVKMGQHFAVCWSERLDGVYKAN